MPLMMTVCAGRFIVQYFTILLFYIIADYIFITCGSYSCVPFMMTVCAGRLTPHASVAVHTSTFSRPSANSCAARAIFEEFCVLFFVF